MGEEHSDGAWLSQRQAAEYLGVSPSTIRRMVESGKLRAYKLGKLRRYKRGDLDACLEPIASEGGRGTRPDDGSDGQ